MSTMRAVVVEAWGEDPKFATVPKPTPPEGGSHVLIKVVAAGLPNLVRSQAGGKHYSVKNATLPYVPGVDGIGTTSSGDFVYFSSMARGGAFAEYVLVSKHALFTVPFPKEFSYEEKVKRSINIANEFNPAMSSWMALQARTQNLRENFTVIINGVTSVSGQIAITNARALGAGKVIGISRSEESLKKLPLDQYIVLQDPADKTDFAGQLGNQRIDVILDYVYGGGSTLQLFYALPADATRADELEVQYIQIGSLGGMEMDLPSALLRSKNLTIRGAGPGSWSIGSDVKKYFPSLIEKLTEGIGEFAIAERNLEDVEAAWADKRARSVFIP